MTLNCSKQMLEYNLEGGKQIRGKIFLNIVHSLGVQDVDDKAIYTVAWTIEILQACCLIADDIVDESVTRRG